MSDERLAEIVAAPIATIADVVAVMKQINDLLPDEGDGLKWFNLLYLLVTSAVLDNPPPGGWQDERWLARLDVNFARLYFAAVGNWTSDIDSAPKSWRVLFDARRRPDVMRVQFALCGMNAHINHDLQFAVVQTCRELDTAPQHGTPQHRDFIYVNRILEEVEPQMTQYLATGIVGVIDQSLGQLDNLLAMWGVREARDTAWAKAEVLWHIRDNNLLRDLHRKATDKLTSAFGRGLIIPVKI